MEDKYFGFGCTFLFMNKLDLNFCIHKKNPDTRNRGNCIPGNCPLNTVEQAPVEDEPIATSTLTLQIKPTTVRIVYKMRKGFGKKELFEGKILEEGKNCLKVIKVKNSIADFFPIITWIAKKDIVIVETFIDIK